MLRINQKKWQAKLDELKLPTDEQQSLFAENYIQQRAQQDPKFSKLIANPVTLNHTKLCLKKQLYEDFEAVRSMKNKDVQLVELSYDTLSRSEKAIYKTSISNTLLRDMLLLKISHLVEFEKILENSRVRMSNYLLSEQGISYIAKRAWMEQIQDSAINKFNQIPSSTDFLFGHKIESILFYHIETLRKPYFQFKSRSEEDISQEIRKKYALITTNTEFIEQTVDFYLAAHRDKCRLYDVLFKIDDVLTLYYQKSHYTHQQIFKFTKELTLAFLSQCQMRSDEYFSHDVSVKTSIIQEIQKKINTITSIQGWKLISPVMSFELEKNQKKRVELRKNLELKRINKSSSKFPSQVSQPIFDSQESSLAELPLSDLKVNDAAIFKVSESKGHSKIRTSEECLEEACKAGDFKTAEPLLKQRKQSLDYYLLITLKEKQVKFVREFLKPYKMPDMIELDTLIPDNEARQKELLENALALTATQNGRTCFNELLTCSQFWKAKLIDDLSKEIQDPLVKKIFDSYQAKQSEARLSKFPVVGRSKKGSRSVVCPPSSGKTPVAPVSLFFTPVDISFSLTIEERKSIELKSIDPRPKLKIFLKIKPTTPIEKELQCQALTLVMLNYFQAYRLTGTDDYLTQLPLADAIRARNALVHQHQAFNFLLDGRGDQILSLAQILQTAIEKNDASELYSNDLFRELLDHGELLKEQKDQGENECVAFEQRLIYSSYLIKNSCVFSDYTAINPLLQAATEHARAMTNILYQVYCRKLSGLTIEAIEEATMLRHADFTFEPRSVRAVATKGI